MFPENTAWQISEDPTKIFLSGCFSFIAEIILVDKKIFSKLESIETKILSSGLDPEFLKKNFFESYCLDSFSINNNHSILIK